MHHKDTVFQRALPVPFRTPIVVALLGLTCIGLVAPVVFKPHPVFAVPYAERDGGGALALPPTPQNFQVSAQNGNLADLRRMLEANPDLAKAVTPALQSAVYGSSTHSGEVVEFLIAHGADVNATDTQGRTPLHNAVMYGDERHLPVVQALVEHGADLNRLDQTGNCPLHLAVAARQQTAAFYLQAHGAHDTTTPLFEALAQGDTAALSAALHANPNLATLSFGPRPNGQPQLVMTEHLTPLHAAVLWNRAPLVQLLLEARAKLKGPLFDGGRDFYGQTPLHEAAMLDEADIAVLLLDAGADPNEGAQQGDTFDFHGGGYEIGQTPLHLAARAGALSVAQLLLRRGAKVDATTSIFTGYTIGANEKPAIGDTPLQYAVNTKNLPLVTLLLEHGANPNGPKGEGTPLLRALDNIPNIFFNGTTLSPTQAPLQASTLAIAQALLQAGADPNARNSPPYTEADKVALDKAFETHNTALLAQLTAARQKRSYYSEREDTALSKALKTRDIPLVTALLDKGADVNAATWDGTPPLQFALNYQDERQKDYNALPALLLSHGTKVDARDKAGRTALFAAVYHANLDMVRQLLEHGADVQATDKDGLTALALSLKEKGNSAYDKITELLRAHGGRDTTSSFLDAVASGDEVTTASLLNTTPSLLQARSPYKETVLSHAIRHHQDRMVTLLLSRGADPEALSNGSSALFMAVDFGPPTTVALLLKHGAKVNARNNEGQTPLFWAVHNSNLEMVNLLLRAGADAKVVDKEKRTPLHSCVDDGSTYDATPSIMDALLRAGADVNAPDRDGSTPLHLAAQNGKRAGVAWLLAHGANVNARDNSGWTPRQWAETRGYAQTAALLK